MTDFLITQITLYPWFTWLLVFFAAAGVCYAAVWAYKVQAAAFAWLGYRRAVWTWKAAVRRVADNGDRLCPVHMLEAEQIGDDPPEYQHDDGDGLDYCEHDVIARTCTRCGYDGLGEDWDAQAGEEWYRTLASPEEFLRKVRESGLDDTPEDEPERCTNRDCYRVGHFLGEPCELAPTQPAACYTDGPAMPPQPVREYLHPAVMDDLEQAGFSEHETTDGAVDSIYTRAMAREVEAMVTDGIIPTSEEEKR